MISIPSNLTVNEDIFLELLRGVTLLLVKQALESQKRSQRLNKSSPSPSNWKVGPPKHFQDRHRLFRGAKHGGPGYSCDCCGRV